MTSTAKPDYWSLLGLSPNSDSSQLKRAFRREARRWHPDLNGNDINAEERFKLVNEAYDVLSDPRKRQAWENENKTLNSKNDPFANGFPDFEEYLDFVLGEKVEEDFIPVDVNKEYFEKEWPVTSEPSPPPIQAYEDLETLVELTPDEALYGTNVEIELEDGTIVEIQTPALAGDGWRLRLEGIAIGGRDHFLQLRVCSEDGLRVDGLRVLYKLEILPPDAVLGCAVEVPTLSGPVTLQVPPQSSSGRLLRLRGRGLELDGKRGDQFVEIVVVVPDEIGDSERALYGRLQELALESE